MNRTLFLSLALAAAGCGGETDAPVLIHDFTARSERSHCEVVPRLAGLRSEVADAHSLSDSTFLVLLPWEREARILGSDLGLHARVAFSGEGPVGVRRPTSATVLGDSLLVIADQARQRLKLLGLDGADRGSIPLGFPPDRLRAAGGRLVVTPLVIGDHPKRLLYTIRGPAVESRAVPAADYGNIAIRSLGNLADLAVFPDGRVLVSHRYFSQRSYRIGAAGSARAGAIPLPDAVRSSFGYIPPVPIPDDAIPKVLASVIDGDVDRRTGDFLYLTRTGVREDGREQKAIIRVDSLYRYKSSAILDVYASGFVYLADRSVAFVITGENEWFACPLPS